MSHATQNKKNRFAKKYKSTHTGALRGFGFPCTGSTGGGVIAELKPEDYTRDENGRIICKKGGLR